MDYGIASFVHLHQVSRALILIHEIPTFHIFHHSGIDSSLS